MYPEFDTLANKNRAEIVLEKIGAPIFGVHPAGIFQLTDNLNEAETAELMRIIKEYGDKMIAEIKVSELSLVKHENDLLGGAKEIGTIKLAERKDSFNDAEEMRQLSEVFDVKYGKVSGGESGRNAWIRPQKAMEEEMETALGGRDPKQVRVLNLGSGDGAGGSFGLVKKGFQTVHIDFSRRAIGMFQEGMKRYASDEERVRTEFKAGDMLEILRDEPDESYDIVHAHLSLMYFSKSRTREIFNQIQRVLKPGGKVVFKVRSRDDTRLRDNWEAIEGEGEFYRLPDGELSRMFSDEELKEILQGANLQEVSMKQIDVKGWNNRPWVVIADKATTSTPGGIDFNPSNIEFKMEGSGVKIQFPVSTLNYSTRPVDGLIPVIINITPVTNFFMLLGENDTHI